MPYKTEEIIAYVKEQGFKNVVVVDATASTSFVKHYPSFVQNGFHIVSANKMANTLHQEFYNSFRQTLKKFNRQFLYETNVGAGLPIVETIRNLHQSGDRIRKVRGVFSGSMSYIFNRFSEENQPFSKILSKATSLGYTEPDAREDLSGQDVARKLLILARELDINVELSDVKVESLVPKQLNGKTTSRQFRSRIKELDIPFANRKKELNGAKVLRYVGELDVENKSLEVKLINENRKSVLGQLKGSDAFFEVFSSSYKDHPLIIQGAGAGKEVTARGLLSDLLKIT